MPRRVAGGEPPRRPDACCSPEPTARLVRFFNSSGPLGFFNPIGPFDSFDSFGFFGFFGFC